MGCRELAVEWRGQKDCKEFFLRVGMGHEGYWGVAWGYSGSEEVGRSTRVTRGGDVGSQEGLK